MMYECTDRRGAVRLHGPLSSELSSKEAMRRLGVLDRPFKVVTWPQGRPDLAHCVQQFEIGET